MIKVLVVDDDHLVRRGFISMMPWEQYGFEIVGQANNGKKALEFLSMNEVNLLITDLAMPAMSGLELMKEVKIAYPHIHMVILTFHAEFDFIQEALRIGAIDYMTKTELEDEKMHVVLERIVSQIREREAPAIQGRTRPEQRQDQPRADSWLTLLRSSPGKDETWIDKIAAEWKLPLEKLSDEVWLSIPENEEQLTTWIEKITNAFPIRTDWILIRWEGLRGMEGNLVRRSIAEYATHRLFYDYRQSTHYYEQSAAAVLSFPEPLDIRIVNGLIERWSSLDWMYQETAYQTLLRDMMEIRPPVSVVESIFSIASTRWRDVLEDRTTELAVKPRRYWEEWIEGLNSLRSGVQEQSSQMRYSDEIAQSIAKAIVHIKQGIEQDLLLPEVAKLVNMSRSYFSRCFREITGTTFHDYVRDLRIRRAETLLRDTPLSIAWIAAQSGYPNEKYFCRVFRECTGVLPSEYRKMKGKVTNRLQ